MEAREYIRAGAETICFIAVSLAFVFIISLACFWLETFSDLLPNGELYSCQILHVSLLVVKGDLYEQ